MHSFGINRPFLLQTKGVASQARLVMIVIINLLILNNNNTNINNINNKKI